ncbi:MAG: hypothetical protein ABFS22_06930 [Pseudomonadota bacterium]
MRYLIYLLVIVNLAYFYWQTVPGVSDTGVSRELPPLPAHTRRLMTLQELKEQQEKSEKQLAVEVSAFEALTELQSPGAGLPLSCYALGPFMAESEVQATESRLDELELESTRRTTEMKEKIGYWIYLPPMERKQALAIKAKLDDNRDKEYYIGKENLISLGAFKGKLQADRRMKQLHKIGIEPVLQPRYATRNVFWLDIDKNLAGDDQDRLRSGLPELDLQEQVCR